MTPTRTEHPSEIPPTLAPRLAAFLAAVNASPMAGRPLGKQVYAMMLLWENLGRPVTQDAIASFYATYVGIHYDRQLRHKAVDGWDLASSAIRSRNMPYDSSLPKHSMVLRSLKDTCRTTTNRRGFVAPQEWLQKVAFFEARPGCGSGGCASCSRKCVTYDRGHLDRNLPLAGDNVVPMCADCNNWFAANECDAYLDHNGIARPVFPGSRRHMKSLRQARPRSPTTK